MDESTILNDDSGLFRIQEFWWRIGLLVEFWDYYEYLVEFRCAMEEVERGFSIGDHLSDLGVVSGAGLGLSKF